MLGCAAQEDSRDTEDVPRPEEHTDVWQASPAAPLSCLQESDCPSRLACVAGMCQPCSAHSQCESDVCDGYAATIAGPGACIQEADVIYTTNVGGRICDFGDGTRSNPACNIFRAISLSVGNRYAIRLAPGSYLPFGVSSATVYIFGPGDGSAVIGEEDGVGARILAGSRVVLDGLRFASSVRTGVSIEDSDVQIHNTTIDADSRAIVSSNSNLNIDRVRAVGHLVNALQVNGSGSYRITNSYFTGSGGVLPTVVFSGASTGRFLFNTVSGGGSQQFPGGIDCGTTSRVIQDSIVVNNFPADGGAQTVGACTHQRVVVGSGDTRADPGLIKIDPDLDAQGRLLDTAANAACCIDRGERFTSSLYRDFYGTPRPQGLSNDIGAYESGQVVQASADAHIRADLDERRNDNYGCQEILEIGTHRGNINNPDGTADAMRALVRFNLTGVPAPLPFIQSAVLEMTVDGFDHGLSTSRYQVDVHRIIPSGARTPWIEGNGVEGPTVPAGCTNVDDAFGVAWDGVENGGDANNHSQPDFDSAVEAFATVSQGTNVRGDEIRWDITNLVRGWSSGAIPNEGILLRDVTTDGSFRGVKFGARDSLLRGFPDAIAGPRLIIIRGRTP